MGVGDREGEQGKTEEGEGDGIDKLIFSLHVDAFRGCGRGKEVRRVGNDSVEGTLKRLYKEVKVR